MREDKKKRLEARGWKIGTAQEFLGLSVEENAYLDIRLRLADDLKRRRLHAGITQTELAKAVRSSQSRVAKMEAGDPAVSIDILLRTLLALGATQRDVGRLIATNPA
jgi:DNA-binding XRE family transcriptional regulator